MKHAALAVLAVLASSACLNDEGTYFDPAAPGYSTGTLHGDLGPIRDLNDNRAVVAVSDVPEFSYFSVQVAGAGNDGTGIVILDLYSVNLQDVPAGTYDSTEVGDITVCSDSNDGSLHFDSMADDATIVVEDINADTREISIHSTVPDDTMIAGGPTTQRASFRVPR